MVKLAAWARSVGVDPQIACAWVREDRMPVPFRRLTSGTILVDVAKQAGDRRVVLYARVSSHDQRADLDRQVFRLAECATADGFDVAQVITEVGSGLNGKRPKLARVLSDPSATVIVVEHRYDRARFEMEHLEAVLTAQGRRIVIADAGDTADDRVCFRLYGRHGARNRAMRAVTAAEQPEPTETVG